MFKERMEAGRQLASALQPYRGLPCTVFALVRGGVPVATEIAKMLGLPLRLLLVRKIGLPLNPEVAMGAVVGGEHPIAVRNEEVIRSFRVSDQVFESCCNREIEEIRRRERVYALGAADEDLTRQIAIIVDDGLATGATAKVAIKALKARRAYKVVVAVPVGAPEAIAQVKREADDVVCLEMPDHFTALSLHYQQFPQLTDQDVLRAIQAGQA